MIKKMKTIRTIYAFISVLMLAGVFAFSGCGDGSSGSKKTPDDPIGPTPVDTSLVSLEASINVDPLNLGFSPEILNYDFEVNTVYVSITFTPVAAEPDKVTITVGDDPVESGSASTAIGLDAGINVIEITVAETEGSESTTYTIEITRLAADEQSSNARLGSLAISNTKLEPVFSSTVFTYDGFVMKGAETVTVTPIASSSAYQDITVDGESVPSGGSETVIIDLIEPGDTQDIVIVVTAQDGTTQETYTITLRFAPSVEINFSFGAVKPSAGDTAGVLVFYSKADIALWMVTFDDGVSAEVERESLTRLEIDEGITVELDIDPAERNVYILAYVLRDSVKEMNGDDNGNGDGNGEGEGEDGGGGPPMGLLLAKFYDRTLPQVNDWAVAEGEYGPYNISGYETIDFTLDEQKLFSLIFAEHGENIDTIFVNVEIGEDDKGNIDLIESGYESGTVLLYGKEAIQAMMNGDDNGDGNGNGEDDGPVVFGLKFDINEDHLEYGYWLAVPIDRGADQIYAAAYVEKSEINGEGGEAELAGFYNNKGFIEAVLWALDMGGIAVEPDNVKTISSVKIVPEPFMFPGILLSVDEGEYQYLESSPEECIQIYGIPVEFGLPDTVTFISGERGNGRLTEEGPSGSLKMEIGIGGAAIGEYTEINSWIEIFLEPDVPNGEVGIEYHAGFFGPGAPSSVTINVTEYELGGWVKGTYEAVMYRVEGYDGDDRIYDTEDSIQVAGTFEVLVLESIHFDDLPKIYFEAFGEEWWWEDDEVVGFFDGAAEETLLFGDINDNDNGYSRYFTLIFPGSDVGSFDETEGAEIRFRQNDDGDPENSFRYVASEDHAGSSVSIVVSSYGDVGDLIKGTFSGTLIKLDSSDIPVPGADPLVVTNGEFVVPRIEK